MPISNEVIELAPVAKTKKKLVIMFVIMGVLLAAAVAFLVMYLLKPNVEPTDMPKVNAVTVTENDLFVSSDGDGSVIYASVGNEYTVKASASVDNNASRDIRWDFGEDYASIEIKAQGESGGEQFITFTPALSANGKTITLTAYSADERFNAVQAKITFTVVNQGAERLVATSYYTNSNNKNNITDSDNISISIPYYSVDRNNSLYYITFDQLGKFNPTTGEYSKLTLTTSEPGVAANGLTVAADKADALDELKADTEKVWFKLKRAESFKLTVTANANNPDAQNISKEITVNVRTASELGYIENIYFLDQAIVDAAFINRYLTPAKELNTAELIKNEHYVSSNNRRTFTIPYNTTYSDIFSHVIVSPISVQFDTTTGELKENWYKNIKVESSSAALRVSSDSTTITAPGLASTAIGANECTLSFRDTTPGGLGDRTKLEVRVHVVARSSAGAVSASGTLTEGKYPTSQNGQMTLNVAYTLNMPGNTDTKSLLSNEYMTSTYKIEFDSDNLEITPKGSTTPIVPNEVQTFNSSDAFAIERTGGSDTSSFATFSALTTFNIRVKENAPDGDYTVRFYKVGTSVSGNDDWAEKDLGDRTWDGSITLAVTGKATEAHFVDNATALKLITGDGARAGGFSVVSSNTANVYVQQRATGMDVGFSVHDLVATNATIFSCTSIMTSAVGVLREISEDGVVKFLAGTANTSPSVVTVRVFAAGETTSFAELTVNFYTADAVTEFESIASVSRDYSGAYTDGTLMIRNEWIRVSHFYNTGAVNYNYIDFDIYFGSSVTSDTNKLEKSVEGGVWTFSYTPEGGEKTPLFGYDSVSHRLSLSTDIYAYSRATNINFSEITLKFKLKDADYYVGEEPYGTMSCTFRRKADGIKVYQDGKEIVPNEQGQLIHSVNQGASVTLSVVSTVNIGGETIVADENIAAVEPAYLQLPSGLADGDGNTRYESKNFIAPNVVSENNIDEYNIILGTEAGTVTGKSLTFHVQNLAREITGISLYTNGDCAEEHLFKADDVLLFGKFNGTSGIVDRTKNTLYIKIAYEPKQDRFVYFEPAYITLPAYLKLNGSYVFENGRYTIVRASADIGSETNEYVFECEMSLSADAANATGLFEIKREQSGNEPIEQERDIRVASGLKGITVVDGEINKPTDDNDGVTIDVEFALGQDGKAADKTFGIVYNPLTADGFSGVKFENETGSPFDVACGELPTGVKFVNSSRDADKPTFTIGVTDAITAPSENLTFAVTLTDKENGAARAFTVTFVVTVKSDIFSLSSTDTVYEAETTGEDSGVWTYDGKINITYNNGSALQPDTATKNNVNVRIVKKTGEGAYAEDRNIVGVRLTQSTNEGVNEYGLEADNNIDILKGDYKDWFVAISYGKNDVKSVYIPIAFKTKSNHIEHAEGGDNVAVSAGKATVTVTSDNNTFKLPAVVVNDGTGKPVTGVSGVTYAVYDSEEARAAGTKSTKHGVDVNGVVTINPDAITGVVYYRASYTDSASNKTYDLDVDLTYNVAVDTVRLVGLDGDTYDENTKTLTLYVSGGAYTYVNIAQYVKVTNDKYGSLDYSGKTVNKIDVKSGDDAVITVSDNNRLAPKTATSGATITVTATFAGTEATCDFTVVVVQLGGVMLDGSAEHTLDILRNDTVTVTPTFDSYNGLDASYSLAAEKAGLEISDTGNVKTVSIETKIVTDYTLTATVSYDLKAGSSAEMSGSFSATATKTIKVDCNYTPEFTLQADGVDVATNEHIIKSGAAYRIKISALQTDATYHKAVVDKAVIENISDFNSGVATFAVASNSSGEFTVTVNATIYGKNVPAEKTYNFVYGADADGELYETNGTTKLGQTVAIDNKDENGNYKFKYIISNVDTTVVKQSDIKLSVTGAVTQASFAAEAEKNRYVVEYTVNKPTTFIVGGTVQVGVRKVYLTTQTVEFTAIKPTFTVTADKNELDPTSVADFTFAQTADAFEGDYTVVYTLVAPGNNFAALGALDGQNGITLTANNNVTQDISFIVRATVTVSNGVYKGTYTVDTPITIKGVPVPSLKWNSASRVVEVGGSGYSVTFKEGTAKEDLTFTKDSKISAPQYKYSVVEATGLVSGTDYLLSGGTLTIYDTDKTKSGGKIVVMATATVTGIHAGAYSVTTEIIIQPRGKTDGTLDIPNGIGATDVKSAFALNTQFVAVGGFFVKEGNAFTVLSVTLDSAVEGVSASGTSIIAEKVLEDGTEIPVTATIRIDAGNYDGYTVSAKATLTVVTPSATDITVTWDDTNHRYNAMPHAVTLPGGATVRALNIDVSSDDIVITNNGANSLTVSAIKTANVGGTQAKPYAANYTATTDNGVYSGTFNINVNAAPISVTATVDEEKTAITNETTISKNNGETFVINLSESSGFTMTIDETKVNVPNGINYTVSKDSVSFTASAVVTNGDVSIPVTVGQGTVTVSFKLTVTAQSTGAAYNVTTNKDDIRTFVFGLKNIAGETQPKQTTVSTWKAQYDDYYCFADTLTFTAPTGRNLSGYLTSLTVEVRGDRINNGSGSNTAKSHTFIAQLSGNSCDIQINTEKNRHATVSTIIITFAFKTDAAYDTANIVASMSVYSNNYTSYNAQKFETTYSVRVIGNYEVTFDGNAPSGETVSGYRNTIGMSYLGTYGTLDKPTCEHYEFMDWFTSPRGGSKVEDNAKVTNTESHTLYAHWTPKTYTVTFNKGFGTEDITYTYGDTFASKQIADPSRTGYTFVGWFDAENGGNKIDLNKRIDANTTVCAHWAANTYTVTLKDGETVVSSFTVACGGTYGTLPKLTKANNTFVGWFTESSGGSQVVDNAQVTKTEPHTLYARWSPVDRYTVTFDKHNGEQNVTVQYYADDTFASKLPADPSKNGYTFVGWFTAETGGSRVAYDAKFTQNTTVHAHWVANAYTVTLDNNGTTTPVSVVYNGVYTLPTPTREGFRFGGWKIAGSETTTAGGTEITVTDNVTYTAVWESPFTVTLKYGDGSSAGHEVYKDDKFTLPTTPHGDIADKTFEGWKQEGSEITVKGGTEITVTGDVTYTEVWVDKTPDPNPDTETEPEPEPEPGA